MAPEGVATGTYRTFELIRLETIPVVAVKNAHWLPYHPALNWSEFAIVTSLDEMPRSFTKMKTMSSFEIARMKENLRKVREEFFDWNGVFKHIDLFFEGGRSYLTCSKAFLTDGYR